MAKDKRKQNWGASSPDTKGTSGEKPKKVAVIGAGTIGASWATLFAAKGRQVNLQDVEEERLDQALKTIISNLKFLTESELLNEDSTSVLKRVHPTTDLSLAVKNVEYVQESAFESYEVKKELFAQMDSICSENVILASSSSGLLMSEIQKVAKSPERCIIAHPFNPPHLIPLVELVPGKRTSEETIETAYRFHRMMGKTPLRVRKEVPGYVANRLCAALWREAIDLVHKEIASVEDVDLAVCRGPGLRWAFMGPHITYHLGGGSGGIQEFIEHIGPTFESCWGSMSSWTSIPPSALKKVVKGLEEEVEKRNLEELARWRDAKLVKILKTISDDSPFTQ